MQAPAYSPLPPASASLLAALALAGCGGGSAVLHGPVTSIETAPKSTACPAEIPAGVSCWAGQDSKGAYYLIAKPAQWNGTLVLHAHGGPDLAAVGVQHQGAVPLRGLGDQDRKSTRLNSSHLVTSHADFVLK